MNFENYVKKIIHEKNPDMDISPEAIKHIHEIINKETYEMAEEILAYKNHKTIMLSDVEFGLRMKRKWGYMPYFFI